MSVPSLTELPQLSEGAKLPERSLAPGIMDVARFIGGAGFAIGIFIDPVVARDHGLEGPLIPAEFKSAFLLKYLRDLAGPGGTVLRLQSAFRRPDYHGNRFTIGGEIVQIRPTDRGTEYELALRIVQANGDQSVRSSATILAPRTSH